MMRKQKLGADSQYWRRIEQCREKMEEHSLDAYLLTNHTDTFYVTGFTGEDSEVLITPKDVTILSDGRFTEAIKQEAPWAKTYMRKKDLLAETAAILAKKGFSKVGVQTDRMTVDDHKKLAKLAKPVKIVAAPPIVNELRKIKDEEEISLIREAIRVAEEAFQAFKATIRPGQTEQEMAARLTYEMQLRGARQPSFPTIVAEGSNAALPHAHPGSRAVSAGSAILFDWGANHRMHCSDLTRCLFVDKIPPRIGEVYRIVLDAQLKAIDAIKPGAKVCDVDAVARKHIAKAGYRKQFGHGLGHGLGLDVHEAPALSWRSDEPLAEGMVVTVEPGIYLPDVGGVRIEDDVLVTANGAAVLTRLDKELESAVI